MTTNPHENSTITTEDMPIGEDNYLLSEFIDVVEASDEWSQWRDHLAQEMFESWMLNHNN